MTQVYPHGREHEICNHVWVESRSQTRLKGKAPSCLSSVQTGIARIPKPRAQSTDPINCASRIAYPGRSTQPTAICVRAVSAQCLGEALNPQQSVSERSPLNAKSYCELLKNMTTPTPPIVFRKTLQQISGALRQLCSLPTASCSFASCSSNAIRTSPLL